jgi:hypothetical protein
MLVVLNQASVMAGSCIIFNHDLHASTNNMREDVDYSGCSASGLIHASAGYVFPGLHVIITGFEQSHIFTSSYLMKNDLNGQFLINQPGRPFKQNPGNTAGADFNVAGTQ